MADQQQTCKNCEQQFDTDFIFCPYCGQKAKDKLTLGVLFYNTISNYFSFDARFFKSFFPLVFKPGYLAKQFVAGKRLLYLHPAQLYLFISVVFFFIFSFIQRDQIQSLDENIAKGFNQEKAANITSVTHLKDSLETIILKEQMILDSIDRLELKKSLEDNKLLHNFSDKQIDSLVNAKNFRKNGIASFDFNSKNVDSLITIKANDTVILKEMGLDDDAGIFETRLYKQALKFYKSKKGGSILQVFYDTIPIAMFFLLPIFALFLKLFYKKSGSYAHHLVFSFYYFSFLFTVFTVIFGINFIYDIPDWIDFLLAISTFIYLIMSLKTFYEQGRLKTFFKGSVVTFLFLSFVAPIAAYILALFAFLFY